MEYNLSGSHLKSLLQVESNQAIFDSLSTPRPTFTKNQKLFYLDCRLFDPSGSQCRRGDNHKIGAQVTKMWIGVAQEDGVAHDNGLNTTWHSYEGPTLKESVVAADKTSAAHYVDLESFLDCLIEIGDLNQEQKDAALIDANRCLHV
jgi:hypothetical protein